MDGSDYSADNFIMLFSSDWFRPYWQALGVKISDEEEARRFQADMRSAVSEMIGQDANYYLISFKPSRAAATRAKLFESLKKYAEPASDLRLLNLHRLDRVDCRAIQGGILLSHYPEWEGIRMAQMDRTEWDKWLQSLIPSTPDFLLYFALDVAGL
jgi:hypothetical protein